mgnify:CR=1 FL=1
MNYLKEKVSLIINKKKIIYEELREREEERRAERKRSIQEALEQRRMRYTTILIPQKKYHLHLL